MSRCASVQALVDELEERLDVCHSKGVEDEEAINKATKASRALREKGNRKSPRKTPRKSPKNAATGMFYTTVLFFYPYVVFIKLSPFRGKWLSVVAIYY